MAAFNFSTGVMELATLASGSVIFAISNPATAAGAVDKPLYIKRMSAKSGFTALAGAATRIGLAVNRATGTAAGGTANASTTGIPARRAGSVGLSVALLRYGPAAVTGMTDATPEKVLKSSMVNHQNGPMVWDELIEDIVDIERTDPLEIAPGTSLIVRTTGASASIAGTAVGIDIEWTEK